jgi:hypothetical protein
LVFRRPARADFEGVGEFCVDFCRDVVHAEGSAFGACVSDCVRRIVTNVNRA